MAWLANAPRYHFVCPVEKWRQNSTSVTVEIPQTIERLEQVYSFDKKCVYAVMSLTGTTAVTQGPQGTVSSVVMEDERRILKSLRNIKDVLVRFNLSLPPNLVSNVF